MQKVLTTLPGLDQNTVRRGKWPLISAQKYIYVYIHLSHVFDIGVGPVQKALYVFELHPLSGFF